MKVIPAIDLMNGKCVRLFKGDFNKRKDFTKEPHEQAKFWESEGAKYIHIVDLDAAKTGSPTNDKSIKKIAKTVNIPIQIGGGIRSQERIEQLFSYGIEKVIMGTSAIENKELVKDLSNKFPGRIIVGIDAKDGKVSTRGWLEQSNIFATDLVKEFSSFKIVVFVFFFLSICLIKSSDKTNLASDSQLNFKPTVPSSRFTSTSSLLSPAKIPLNLRRPSMSSVVSSLAS